MERRSKNGTTAASTWTGSLTNNNDDRMSDPERKIECPTHGEAYATFVCRHLVDNPQQRWFCDAPSRDNRWPDAWCHDCDRAFQKHGEWNDRNESVLGVQLICHRCYEERKASSVAPLMAARRDGWKPFLSEAISDLQTKQDLLEQWFGLSKHERWDWDQETGGIVFSNGGVPALVARIQFVGSVSTLSNTWLWSWANPSIEAKTADDLLAVRTFGEAETFANLTVPKWPADEVDGWEMTAVAAKILDAQGAYRTSDDKGFTFMLLTEVSASSCS